MAWLEDLVTQLEAEGVGTFGVSIFASSRASVPVLASGLATVHIIETGGEAPENTHNALITPGYLQPGAQITSRADDYDAAMAKARQAYNALFKVRNQFINSGWYKWIKPLQEPFDLQAPAGVDPRGQCRIVFNVIGNKRP